MAQEEHQTLGNAFIPSNYSITIEPNFKSFRYPGKIVIYGKAARPISTIRLNERKLAIKKVVVKSKAIEQSATVRIDEEKEEFAIVLKQKVSGDFTIAIDFEGEHNDKMYGFYRSKYTYKGKSDYILSSQFEPVSARAAFPCVDEPEFKATFDLSLIIDNDLDAISNMPVKATRKMGKKKCVTFQTTPKMSTYLLYMGTGKYEHVDGKAGKTKLRVLTTPGKRALARLALEYSQKILPQHEKYFGIKFVLPKLDLIAIPDFAVSAMENWGAITFRETALLGDYEKASVSARRRIAEVVAHETAHQWFGDLVTMKWWDDLWLNESFATFMEYKTNSIIFPEWKPMLKLLEDDMSVALSSDSYVSTHPISVRVNTPGEVASVFDEISYDKGCCVLHMMEDYVGEETFRKGLNAYLNKYKYSNASKVDLWNSVQQAAKSNRQNNPVASVAEAWVNKMGHPIVLVKQDPSTGNFTLEQKRFTLLDKRFNEIWPIPIRYISESGEQKLLMKEKSIRIKASGHFLKLNYGQAGVYRVGYGEEQLKEIGKRIREKKLKPEDAWGVEFDLYAMARSSRVKLTDYMRFINRYMMESEYPASISISGHLNRLLIMGMGERYELDIRRTSIKFHKRILMQLGWERGENESSIDTRMRSAAIGALGLAGDEETITKVNSIFESFLSGEQIDQNIKGVIFSIVAMSQNDQSIFDRFIRMYNSESESPEDKIKALQAIGNFKEQPMISAALNLSISDKVRLQDSILLIMSVAVNPYSRPVLLKWIEANWKRLLKMYDPATKMLDNCVNALALYSGNAARNEIKEFFENRENFRDDMAFELKKTLEAIELNTKFLEVNRR